MAVLLAAVGADLLRSRVQHEKRGEPQPADGYNMRARNTPTQHNACYLIIFAHISVVGEYATLEADLEQSPFPV
jgi:hypothetical protein